MFVHLITFDVVICLATIASFLGFYLGWSTKELDPKKNTCEDKLKKVYTRCGFGLASAVFTAFAVLSMIRYNEYDNLVFYFIMGLISAVVAIWPSIFTRHLKKKEPSPENK